MNKAELVEALAARLGDKKAAAAALEAVLAEVQSAVSKGDRVTITGFGVFEKRVRDARTARNPRTGEVVKVKKTSVPAFRAGAGFKEMVASGRAPKAAVSKRTSAKAIKAGAAAKTSATGAGRSTDAPTRKKVKKNQPPIKVKPQPKVAARKSTDAAGRSR